VDSVCLVGSRNFNTFGSHGSDIFVHLLHFETLEACCEALKEQHGAINDDMMDDEDRW
jgi:hypothetical protein